jgi:UDP-glucose 4-epimerase
MSTCLVTGVAGFIGSHLAERLLHEGYHVVGIDGFTDYYPRASKERNLTTLQGQPGFTLIEADLLALDLPRLLSDCGCETIFHSAAQPGVRASWGATFEVYTQHNLLATQRLLEACRTTPQRRFVYASSSSIYGDAETLPTPEYVTPHPISPYGVTKLAGEHLCRLYWRTAGIPTVSLRYFTVYGPRQRPDMAFHRFIRALLAGEMITIYGDGEQTRDFTFIADVVEANLLAARQPVAGQVFNIGGGSQASVNQVLSLLEQLTGQSTQVQRHDRQLGDVRHTAADISQARQLLGWRPAVTLVDGLAAQVAWQQAQGNR